MRPFTFIGVPEMFVVENYLTVRVLEVRKGSYARGEVAFDMFKEGVRSLEAGKKYLIEAASGRDGMLMLRATLLEEPNQPPEPTR